MRRSSSSSVGFLGAVLRAALLFRYLGAAAEEPEQDAPTTTSTYCDSIGCGQPRYANGVEIRVLPMFWAANRDHVVPTSDDDGSSQQRGAASSPCEEVHGERFTGRNASELLAESASSAAPQDETTEVPNAARLVHVKCADSEPPRLQVNQRLYPAVVARWEDEPKTKTRGALTSSSTTSRSYFLTTNKKGAFAVSVLGATVYETGQVEVAIFVHAHESRQCVLADGQRTFSSAPMGYLAEWSCVWDPEPGRTKTPGADDGAEARGGVLVVKAAVVSYSSAVVSLFCDFRPVLNGRSEDAGRRSRSAGSAPPSSGVFSSGGFLQLRSRSAGADWAVPVPLRQVAHVDSSPAAIGSKNYPRALSVCSQVLYKLDGAYAQKLLRRWLDYHAAIGVSHFVLYDRDGSLQPFVDAYERPANLTLVYHGNWSQHYLTPAHHAVQQDEGRMIDGKKRSGLPSHAAPDAAAAAHCILSQRGASEFVAMLHSPDEYLSNGKGMRHVEDELLPTLRQENIDVCDVSQVYFVDPVVSSRARAGAAPGLVSSSGDESAKSTEVEPGGARQSVELYDGGENADESLLTRRFVLRADKPLLQPRGWGSSFGNSFLNRFGSPILRPEAVSELVAAHYARPNNWDVLDEENVLVRDESATWWPPT
eukprot:g6317.t1